MDDKQEYTRIIRWLKVLEHFGSVINWDGISEETRDEYAKVRHEVPLDEEIVELYRTAKKGLTKGV